MEKGITLITLIITILVMIIIMGTITIVSTDFMEVANDNKLQEELTMVNNVISESYANYIRTKDNRYLSGERLTSNQVQEVADSVGIALVIIPNNIKEQDANLSEYYRLTPTDLTNIGIEDAKDTYVVNYLTGEVINETKANEGVKLYMFSREFFDRINDVTTF